MTQPVVTGKPELLKYINRNLVIKLIVRHGEISRSQLARETGLALPSIMRIVDGLVEEGLVVESGKGDSSGGRKPALIQLNRAYKVIVGIEIAVQTTIVLTDFGGEPFDHWSSEPMAYMTPEAMLETILEQLTHMLATNEICIDRVEGIGIGTPGMNFKHSQSIKRSILKGWENIDVKSWFEARTSFAIYVDNVARTRTLSELWFGHGKEYKSFLYVFVDQGVGVGIVNKGTIYEGANGVAGEFGHMSVDWQGRQCYCGKKGCIEMYVSAGALLNAVEGLDPKTSTLADLEKIQEMPAINELLMGSGEMLAFGIGNLVNFYNPPVIILGGMVCRKMKPLVAKTRERLESYVFNNSAAQTPVLVSELDNELYCLGSVALVINECFKTVELK